MSNHESVAPDRAEGDALQEGVNLTVPEAAALAKRVIARVAADQESWLDWGDYPELGEHAFERLCDAVKNEARAMAATVNLNDRATLIDSQHLLSVARG